MAGFRYPADNTLYVLYSVQPGSQVQSASYCILGSRGLFPLGGGLRRPAREFRRSITSIDPRNSAYIRTNVRPHMYGDSRRWWFVLCCAGFILSPSGIAASVRKQISSIHWAQVTRFCLKTETESSLRNVVFQIGDRPMDNVGDCDKYKLRGL
jgi:hypothetical protein